MCDLIEDPWYSFYERLHFFREQIERVHVPNEVAETKIFLKQIQSHFRNDCRTHVLYIHSHLVEKQLMPSFPTGESAVQNFCDQPEDSLDPGIKTMQIESRRLQIPIIGGTQEFLPVLLDVP